MNTIRCTLFDSCTESNRMLFNSLLSILNTSKVSIFKTAQKFHISFKRNIYTQWQRKIVINLTNKKQLWKVKYACMQQWLEPLRYYVAVGGAWLYLNLPLASLSRDRCLLAMILPFIFFILGFKIDRRCPLLALFFSPCQELGKQNYWHHDDDSRLMTLLLQRHCNFKQKVLT